jgi:hypothetical protein
MITTQMIIKIDEATEFDNLPEDQQADIQVAGVQWPESQMIGTQAVDGKVLILIVTTANETDLGNMILSHELDWEVLAVEGETINQSLLLPYYLDVPVFDEDGEQTGAEAITDLTGKIQTFAGHIWSY